MRYTKFFPMAALLTLNTAVAQTTNSIVNTEINKVGAPSPRSSLGTANAVQLDVASGDSNATIKLSRDFTDRGDNGQRLAFIASAPVSKGNSNFISLDGLSNGTTLEIRTENWRLNGVGIIKSADALRWCTAVHLEEKYEELTKSPKGYECNIQTAEYLNEKGVIERGALDDFRRMFFRDNATVTTWGITARFGYEDIDYYEISKLNKKTTREGVWAVGIFGSRFRLMEGRIFSGSLNFERAVEHRDQEIRCQPIATNATTTSCVNGIIGNPGHNINTVVGFEYRQRTAANLAFAMQVKQDIRNHITAFQLPIYFIQSKKDGLTGGVSAGWNSRDRKPIAGLFLGQAFSWFDKN